MESNPGCSLTIPKLKCAVAICVVQGAAKPASPAQTLFFTLGPTAKALVRRMSADYYNSLVKFIL
ncbi:hypothetical protein BDV59DRAFT_189528 [Aspergillus ambiguus]|uniref:uncharacterized protein n=1 Tax=Aspergillus ambiguus TaxID=176160 RepID=UPI003CCDFDBD